MSTTKTASGREPLSRASIVAAAVALADEEGVGALTMRKLARRLGYEVMSLYNHVANKAELLALMIDAVAAEIDEPAPELPPLEAVRAIAISTRVALATHHWAPELWQQYPPGPVRTDQMEALLRTLDETGLSPDLAHHGFHAVNNHVLGYTLQERGLAIDLDDPDALEAKGNEFLASIAPDAHPYTVAHVHQHLDGETEGSFELVLDLILDGLVRLNAGRSRPVEPVSPPAGTEA